MVRKALRRLHYRLKGWLIERKAGRHKFRDGPAGRRMDAVEKKHLWLEQEEKTKQGSLKAEAARTVADGNYSRHIEHGSRINHAHSGFQYSPAHEMPQPPHTKHVPPRPDFHPYRKRSAWDKLQLQLQERGTPPLPILLLTAIVLIGAAMSVFSIGIYAFSPKEADVYVAIQALDGNVLKGAEIVLSDPVTFERKLSAATGTDGLAFFPLLPVNAKFVVHAEKGGRRIEVEERELKVPLPQGRKEIIFVKRAVS